MPEKFGENLEAVSQTSEKEKELEYLINLVNEEYKADGVDQETIKLFEIHNRQVLDFVRKIAREEGLSEEELKIAEWGAILHDVKKGKEFEEHGKNGGEFARDNLIKLGKSEELARKVQLAIERHMANNGFVASRAREKFGENFRYEEPETRADKCLYDADMLTVLTPEGVNKLLRMREIDPGLIEKDEETAKKENISVREAAMNTIRESVENNLNSLKLDSSRRIARLMVKELSVSFPDLKLKEKLNLEA